MRAVDRFFTALCEVNPHLRARVGNPDELASNRLNGVLKALKHRVLEPESELEAIDGGSSRRLTKRPWSLPAWPTRAPL
jgi:phosphoketolase